MPEKKKKLNLKAGNALEKLTPIFLIASVGLAFAVGVLWQKVNNLEEGSKAGSAAIPQGEANPQAAPSKLNDMESIVESIGIDTKKFASCIDEGKYEDRVESDLQGGAGAGVRGTPGNFIISDNGDVWFVPGAFPFEQIQPFIELALGREGSGVGTQGIEKLSADAAAQIPPVSDQDHVRGNRGAKVLLIEYSDFECPFCSNFHATAQQIIDEYGDDVAWIYRHYPLDQLHPNARPAAIASECVTEIGGDEAFWKFADEAFGF